MTPLAGASFAVLILVPGSLVPSLLRVSPIARSRIRRVLLLTAATAYAIAMLALSTRLTTVATILASATVGGAIAAWWRARADHGVDRGLPPGSLGLKSSLAALADYNFYKKQAARHGPVFKTNQYLRPVVCIVGLERGRALLREHRDALKPAPLPIDRYISGGLIRYMPPERHDRYRKLLLASMGPEALAPNLPFAVASLRAALDSMARDAVIVRPPGVRPARYLDEVLLPVFLKVFFGLEPDPEEHAEIRGLYQAVDHRRRFRRSAETERGFARLRTLVGERARTGSANGPSFLTSAIEHDPGAAEDPVLLDNLAFLLHTTRCDMVGLLVWHLKFLCDHPDWAERIRDDVTEAGDTSGPGAARRFVLETLRLRQSEFIYRVAGERIPLEEFEIPSGWLVRICVRESHTDAAVFDAPHDFDPDRFLDRSWSQTEYSPFGAFDHACIGAHMARRFSQMLVEIVATDYRFDVIDDGAMELGWSHHGHWIPSHRFRVRPQRR